MRYASSRGCGHYIKSNQLEGQSTCRCDLQWSFRVRYWRWHCWAARPCPILPILILPWRISARLRRCRLSVPSREIRPRHHDAPLPFGLPRALGRVAPAPSPISAAPRIASNAEAKGGFAYDCVRTRAVDHDLARHRAHARRLVRVFRAHDSCSANAPRSSSTMVRGARTSGMTRAAVKAAARTPTVRLE